MRIKPAHDGRDPGDHQLLRSRHYMFKGKVETKSIDGLGDFAENGGAAIFALVPSGDAEPLAAWFGETYPSAEVEIIDPATLKADLDALQAAAAAAEPVET